MTSYLWLFGILLLGQVNATNDRYGPVGQSQPPPTANSPGGLVEILETPQGTEGGQGPAQPSSRSTVNPFGATGSSPGDASAAALQPDNSTLPNSGTSSPQRTAPPPGYEFQAQPPPQQRGVTPPSQAPTLKPSSMMRAMLTPPPDSRLAGQPMTLVEVVAGATSRAEQTHRVEAYWDLCSSVADYYLGLREQEEMRRLRTLVPSLGPAGQQAEKELAVRVGTSQRGAVASQYRLASWIGPSTGLPLPADIPHCGSYQTHYTEIFGSRQSIEAQEINALLPLRYAELKDATTAVTRAEEWLNMVAAARSDQSDATGTLRALELLALRRRAFVQIARDYNRRIARYSELATPGQVDADRLIGMLIKRDTPSTATRPFTQAAPLNRQSQNQTGIPPSTFAEGWTPSGTRSDGTTRDESVQPASADAKPGRIEERSLLVPHR
jgi:hypothetical protein